MPLPAMTSAASARTSRSSCSRTTKSASSVWGSPARADWSRCWPPRDEVTWSIIVTTLRRDLLGCCRRGPAQQVYGCCRAGALSSTAAPAAPDLGSPVARSEEHTSELQSLMRISYAVFCLQTNKIYQLTPLTHSV